MSAGVPKPPVNHERSGNSFGRWSFTVVGWAAEGDV
jgi:hypothetical protein